MKEYNDVLEAALRVLYNYVFEDWKRKCQNCPYMTRGNLCKEEDRKQKFCAVEAAFNVIHQEILRIKD